MGLGYGIRKKPIPDPGSRVKKAPYPGSWIRNTAIIHGIQTPVAISCISNCSDVHPELSCVTGFDYMSRSVSMKAKMVPEKDTK
jgi:hypothetical protein